MDGSECAMTLVQLKVVMAGLDPAIHVRATAADDAGHRVDAWVKPAHDDFRLVPIRTEQSIFLTRAALREPGEECPGHRASVGLRLHTTGERPPSTLMAQPVT